MILSKGQRVLISLPPYELSEIEENEKYWAPDAMADRIWKAAMKRVAEEKEGK
jgi:hypothetical protein